MGTHDDGTRQWCNGVRGTHADKVIRGTHAGTHANGWHPLCICVYPRLTDFKLGPTLDEVTLTKKRKIGPREDTSRYRTDHRRRCRADACPAPDRMGGRLLRLVRTGGTGRILFHLSQRSDSLRRLP
jgi:hypothetical protein